VRPFLAVVPDPIIEVGLQAVDRRAELLAEGDAIELVKHGFVETLDDAVIPAAPCCPAVPAREPRYGEPIWDTGRREHECAGTPAAEALVRQGLWEGAIAFAEAVRSSTNPGFFESVRGPKLHPSCGQEFLKFVLTAALKQARQADGCSDHMLEGLVPDRSLLGRTELNASPPWQRGASPGSQAFS
jgi:hypothetical protein